MATTRVFKSGNSQAVRIPAELAYDNTDMELTITRLGDVITIFPGRQNFREAVEELRKMPKAPPFEKGEPIEMPDRDWD